MNYKKSFLYRIARRENWTCWLCGERIQPYTKISSKMAVVDHQEDLELSSKIHSKYNYRLAHAECKKRKDSTAT
jgi:hypothetical protein